LPHLLYPAKGETRLHPAVIEGQKRCPRSRSLFDTCGDALPSDLFTAGSVASVSGFSGTGAGIGTIIASKLIGYFSDPNQRMAGHSFDKIVIVAGLLPFLGMLLVLLLARNTRSMQQGLVQSI
jgi:ACS family hexuronate transporter-like MFS transporter